MEQHVVRTLAITISLTLASCGYGASFRDCAISCSSASGCPDGFSCSMSEGLCRIPGVTATCAAIESDGGVDGVVDARCPGDLDCDGVPDAMDNCPTTKNADQHDEDNDGLGDVCDPCPPFSDNTDGDQDGVGNLCDPRPTMTGDKLWLFEGFQHGVPSAWTPSPLTAWVPTNGEDVVATIGSAGGTASLAFDGSTDPHWTVSTAFTVTTLAEGSGKTTFPAVAAGSMDCGTFDDICVACGGERVLTLADSGGLKHPTPYQLSQGQEYVVHLDQLDGAMFDCHASHPDQSAGVTTGSASGSANGHPKPASS